MLFVKHVIIEDRGGVRAQIPRKEKENHHGLKKKGLNPWPRAMFISSSVEWTAIPSNSIH